MKALVMVSSVEPTDYIFPEFEDIKALLTEAETAAAQVKGFLVKGVEPGSDDVFAFRIAADHAPKDIDDLFMLPAEIDCRGVVARGWVPRGQTKGSIDAKVTFQAVSITAVDRKVALAEMQRRKAQTTQDAAARQTQRKAMEKLRLQIDERLKGAQPSDGAKASK